MAVLHGFYCNLCEIKASFKWRFASGPMVAQRCMLAGKRLSIYIYIYIFNGKIFFVKETMSCDVKNVIYALQCNGCQEYYIGQTGDKLRSRRTVHAQQIRDPSTRQLPLSGHIDICCQTDPKFTMFPFYKMHSESISARLAKGKHFIKCFNPKLNAL